MRIPFNIGTDICHIPRIYRLLTKNGSHGGKRFLEKVLNEREMVAEKGRLPLLQEQPGELARWVAGRWAAKEAAIKAHPHRVLSRHDITIIRRPPRNGLSQAPVVFVRARQTEQEEVGLQQQQQQVEAEAGVSIDHYGEYAAAACVAAVEETEVKVSISHDGDYATAVCLATAEETRALR